MGGQVRPPVFALAEGPQTNVALVLVRPMGLLDVVVQQRPRCKGRLLVLALALFAKVARQSRVLDHVPLQPARAVKALVASLVRARVRHHARVRERVLAQLHVLGKGLVASRMRALWGCSPV